MGIDIKATNEMFDTRCVSRSAWARKHSINPTTFYARLNGRLNMPVTLTELLKAEGLLVEKGE